MQSLIQKTMILGAGLGFALSASAAVTTFTNQAAFLAAAGSTTVETFTSAPLGAFSPTNSTFTNIPFNGFTLSGDANNNFVGIANTGQGSGGQNTPIPATFTGQNFVDFANISGGIIGGITFNLAAGNTALGFDWFNTDVTDQYQLMLSTGEVFTAPPFTVSGGTTASTGFFGVVSTTPFTSATITNVFNGGYISDEGFDNVRVSGGSLAVPEPASLGLVALALTGLAAVRRRRS